MLETSLGFLTKHVSERMSKLSLPIPKRVLAPTDRILPMTTWERENRLVETPMWMLFEPTLSTRSFAMTLPTHTVDGIN